MPAICTIIPPHILQAVVQSTRNDHHVRRHCQATLDRTHTLRGSRLDMMRARMEGASSQHRQLPQGIVPPHIHAAIASNAPESEARSAAQSTLERDNQMRAARSKTGTDTDGAKSDLNRVIYDMQHSDDYDTLPGKKVLIKEGGSLISAKDDPSGDPNECYNGFATTFEFYQKIFDRDSLDNKGLQLVGSVHFGEKYQNAFWDGKQMVFGDGDGVIFNGFTDELDVIGHELTHGVVQYTCNLDYEAQSGALNESLADCFGIMIKQYKQRQTAEQADWLIGEGIWAKGVNGKALRSMKAPGTAYDDPKVGKDPQPATMKDYQDLPNTSDGDNGGVHINSGIPNHAFYLAATKIGGNSWEGAGPIWYKTMAGGKLKNNAQFQDFADLTVANAGEHADKVKAAWAEVGITVGEKKEL